MRTYGIILHVLRTSSGTLLLILMVTGTARAEGSFTGWAAAASGAAAALAAGDAADAERGARDALASITQGEAEARARVLLARALERQHRPADAASELSQAVDALPAGLRPAARARLATDLLAAGRPAESAAVFALAAAGADRALATPLAAAEARSWIADGEPLLAARAAAPGAAAGDPASRLALGRAWLSLGDPRAPSLLRELAVDRAGEPDAEAAARLLRDAAPSTLSLQDHVDRARRLLAATRTEGALAEIEQVEAFAPGTPLPAVLRAMALLQLGRPAEAERIAAPVARLPGPGEPAAARYVLARAAARQGRIDEAVAAYRVVARERPVVPGLGATQQGDLPDDAAYLAAWLPYEAGRFAEASAALRAFAREHPRARRAPDARWFSAWALLRAGDRKAARAALAEISRTETGPLRAAALYWQARIEPDPAQAAALYVAAAAEPPAGWHALLASARLAALGQAPPPAPALPPSPLPDPPGDPGLSASLELAVDLAAVGLREESGALLQRLSVGRDARARASLVGEVAAFTGDAEVPYRMARDHLPPGIRARRWSYPDAHGEVLGPAARRLGVDPALALAVMRRESAFVATARSGAAAEGVLQLRPETARRLKAIAGLPEDTDLDDPAENLRLGIAYLGLLSDRFPTVAQALAAYNAGPTPAATWSRTGAGLPLDEWAEGIPYRETRQYVRSVVADWTRYRALRGEPDPGVDPSTPVAPPGPGVAF
jgi:soluble lytic murein transglycosylase